jgi:alanine-glyoxylate transaminase / serine-glyoxylate transaminase / serine-pyruvate transaminase
MCNLANIKNQGKRTMPGTKGLFIPGPTNVPQSVRLAMDIGMEDHRAPDQPAFTLPLFQDLKQVFKSHNGQVFLFPSSGTGGWEAAITNTLSPGDRVLIARFGQFSLLWAAMCEKLGLIVDIVEAPWGEGVPVEIFAEKLKADKTHTYKAVLVTHNETATGVTSDIAAVRRAMDAAKHPALLFIDAVSSLASVDFRMDEWAVDICVSGSQKGFMMPAGLAILCVSQKALAVGKNAGFRRAYFDFADMTKLNSEGYFPYTPPLHMLRALRASVDLLLNEGLENVFARHHRLAEGVRRAVAAWGLKLCAKEPKWHSDTVSAILVPEGFDSGTLVRHAYAKYQLSLGAGLNQVAGKVFRIGHLGDLNELMCLTAIAGSEMAMRDLNMPVEAGSGVAAAIEYYRGASARSLIKDAA